MCLSVNRKRKERKYLSVKDMGRNVQVNLRELEEIQEQCYTHTASVLCENIRERERDRPKVATENAFERERENGNAVTRERERKAKEQSRRFYFPSLRNLVALSILARCVPRNAEKSDCNNNFC